MDGYNKSIKKFEEWKIKLINNFVTSDFIL